MPKFSAFAAEMEEYQLLSDSQSPAHHGQDVDISSRPLAVSVSKIQPNIAHPVMH